MMASVADHSLIKPPLTHSFSGFPRILMSYDVQDSLSGISFHRILFFWLRPAGP